LAADGLCLVLLCLIRPQQLNTWWLPAAVVVVAQLQIMPAAAAAVQADIEQHQDLQWLPALQLPSQLVVVVPAPLVAELAEKILFFQLLLQQAAVAVLAVPLAPLQLVALVVVVPTQI
jgi:hypothetical protein